MRICRFLIPALFMSIWIATPGLAAFVLSGERLPVALEDGRLRWQEGRYVDPEGPITDYWVAPQGIFFAVGTPSTTLLKRLDPGTATLELLLTVPAPGVVRFHPIAAYALVPTVNAWQFVELPYQAPTPRLLFTDPTAPHVSGYLTGLVIRRGTQLWHLTPNGPLSLIDSDVTEWQPGRDLFDTPDTWIQHGWIFRTISPLLPSGLYRRASGHSYVLNPNLQPSLLLLPPNATLLPLHPEAVVDTGFVAIARSVDQQRRIELWSLHTHHAIPIDETSDTTPRLDPTSDTLIWGHTPRGVMAALLHETTLRELHLETGIATVRATLPRPSRHFDIHIERDSLWVRPDHDVWYEIGTTRTLPADTDWTPIPTTLPAPTGVTSPLRDVPPVASSSRSDSSPATPVASESPITPSTQSPDVRSTTPPSQPEPVPSSQPVPSPPPAATLPVTPVEPPPSARSTPPPRSSRQAAPISAPQTQAAPVCFTLASAGVLRAFPDAAAPRLAVVPPRTIYRQTVTTLRSGHRWYQLTLDLSPHDSVTGWVSGTDITPLGPCQADGPSAPDSTVHPSRSSP